MTIDTSPGPAGPAGPAVVGWNPHLGAWATEATATADVEPVPALHGRLELPTGAESFDDDFGHLVRHHPQCVLRPGSPQDFAAVVAYARRCGVKVAVNGQGGRDDLRESQRRVDAYNAYGRQNLGRFASYGWHVEVK